jgi:hypothetical protein
MHISDFFFTIFDIIRENNRAYSSILPTFLQDTHYMRPTMIQTPYLLFLGDARDALAAKVAQGIKDWRPEYALGQFRMEGCKADMKLPDMTLTQAKAAGCKTLVIGVANRGGVISPAWKKVLVQALEEGFDLASGLHNLLRDEADLVAVAAATGQTLHAAQNALASECWPWAPIVRSERCIPPCVWMQRCARAGSKARFGQPARPGF